MEFKKVSICFTFLAGSVVLNSCGSSSSSSSALSTTMGTLVVTSPTASRSSSTSLLPYQLNRLLAKFDLTSIFIPNTIADTPPDSDIKPVGTMMSDLKNDVSSTDPDSIAKKVGNMSVTSYRANCYGPTWTDDATGSTVSRPSGDLGMVSQNASSTDATACAAAELNSLMGGAPQFANKIMKLQATMVAAMNKAGKGLPNIGGSIDALSLMPQISGLKISTAKVSRLSNRADGNYVFKSVIAFSDASSKEGTVTIYHTPTNSDNTNYIGLIQAVVPHTATGGGSGTKRGISVVYEQNNGVLTYALDTAANRNTDSSDFFSSSSGRIDFTKAAFGEDGNRIIATFNSKTNAATMHYAWQAGSNDGAVRAFAINIPAGSEGSLSGVGYFGFGATIASLTDDVSSPWMTKMYCNWLNGLANGPSVLKVQGQTFSQSGSKFIAATSNINFAPTDTCSKSGSFTVSSSIPSDYNGSRTANPHNLVSVGDLGSIPGVTVPSYSIPSS